MKNTLLKWKTYEMIDSFGGFRSYPFWNLKCIKSGAADSSKSTSHSTIWLCHITPSWVVFSSWFSLWDQDVLFETWKGEKCWKELIDFKMGVNFIIIIVYIYIYMAFKKYSSIQLWVSCCSNHQVYIIYPLKTTKEYKYFINTKNILSCVCRKQFKFPSK